jgi:hypothetical protein
MIREVVVFRFWERGCPLMELIKQIVDAVEFLQYRASERELVNRILMNIHRDIQLRLPFYRRQVHIELRDMIGLTEEYGDFGGMPAPVHRLK